MDPLARTDVTPYPKPVSAVKAPKVLNAGRKQRTNLGDSAAWYVAVMAKRTSMIWTAEDYQEIAAGQKVDAQAHHIVPRQQCRKHDAPEWDARNGVPVSVRRHARHHGRVEPIERSELPAEVFAFLADYPALQPYFDKTYPEAVAA